MRIWTGVNGKTFQGEFINLTSDGKSAQFRDPEGKLLTVPLERFALRDRQLLLKPSPTPKEGDGAEKSDMAAVADPARLMPQLYPAKSYGAVQGSMLEALCMGMVWWDEVGHLKLPTTGSTAKRAGWLLKRLERYVDSDAGVVNVSTAWTGVEDYFAKEMKGVASCIVNLETNDFSPEVLSKLTKGKTAVVLRMSMVYSTDKSFSVSTLLESMTPDGKFSMVLDGVRLKGRMVKMEGTQSGPNAPALMEFVIENRDELHERYVKNGAKFYLGWRNWNGVLSMTPVLLNDAVEHAVIADDEEMPVWEDNGIPTLSIQMNVKFPIAFTSPVVAEREWHLRDGKSAQASVVSKSGSRVTLKRAPGGQQVALDVGQLTEEDVAAISFWEASKGAPAKFPPLQLEYRIDTPSGPYEFTISSSAGMGRIDYKKDGIHNYIIYDTSDGAFAMDKRWSYQGKRFHSDYTGRFLKEYMMAMEMRASLTQGEIDHFVEKIFPSSREGEAVVPCRTMNFPLDRNSMEFREPKIDFVLSEENTVLVALRLLLEGITAGPEGGAVINPIHRFPMSGQGYTLIPILASCKILPINMSWHNQKHPREKELEGLHHSGKFSLKLTRAIAPAGFPKDHFAIPPSVRSMAPGKVNNVMTHTDE